MIYVESVGELTSFLIIISGVSSVDKEEMRIEIVRRIKYVFIFTGQVI